MIRYSYDRTAKELARKHNRYDTHFYGDDDGSWDAGPIRLGWRSQYDWEAVSSLSSRNQWQNLSVEGATEYNAGLRKALREMVRVYPELMDFEISFDGPAIPVRKLVGGPSEHAHKINWGSIVFYHGTSLAAWERIQHEGLRPRSATNVAPAYGVSSSAGESNREAVYLTTQIQMAHFAAMDAAKRSTPVVLQVRGLEGSNMAADEDSRTSTAEESLARIGSVAYFGSIPAHRIELYEQMVDRRWEKV